jgi:hypothetical protein
LVASEADACERCAGVFCGRDVCDENAGSSKGREVVVAKKRRKSTACYCKPQYCMLVFWHQKCEEITGWTMKLPGGRTVLLSIIITIIVLVNGCIKKVQTSVPAFAQAVTLTATNVQAAFETVQNTYYDAAVLNYAASYDKDGGADFLSIGNGWLSEQAVAARVLVLQGLKRYASELSALAAANAQVDPATNNLSASLKSLASSVAADKSVAAKLQLPENLGPLGVNALANWLIDAKLHKQLPSEIEKMDEPVQSISHLLIADIGDRTDASSPSKGYGLRQVLWMQYGKEITAWDGYVRANYLNGKASPDVKLAAIKQIASLAAQRKAADQTLAQVSVTIKQMAQAHSELVKAARTNQNLTADCGALLAEAQRLNEYYQSLLK